MLWLAVAAAIASPASAGALPPLSGTAQSSPLEQLLDLMVAEQQVVTAAIANFDVSFSQSFEANGGAAVEAKYPGVRKAAADAGRVATVALLHQNYGTLRALVGGMVRSGMTDSEIEDAIRFYGSPTGRKLIAAVASQVRGSTASQLQASAGEAAVKAVSPEDQPALTAFMRTGAFAKITVIGPKIQQASIDWGQQLIEAHSAQLRGAVAQAVQAHISKSTLKAGSAQQ